MTENPLRSRKDEPTMAAASMTPPLLAVDEPRARVESLSLPKRNALVACFKATELRKKGGAWHGSPDGRPASGLTIANLARDGMLTVTTNYQPRSARLTERGRWFARTLLDDGAGAE